MCGTMGIGHGLSMRLSTERSSTAAKLLRDRACVRPRENSPTFVEEVMKVLSDNRVGDLMDA